jgi:hypothetical protein
LQSVFALVLGADNGLYFSLSVKFRMLTHVLTEADQSRAMQKQMSMGAMGAPPDPAKAFQAQWEAIEVAEHKDALADVEARLVESTL